MYISILIRIRVYIYPHSYTRSVTICRPLILLQFGRYSYTCIHLFSFVYEYTYILIHTRSVTICRPHTLLRCGRYPYPCIHVYSFIHLYTYTTIHIQNLSRFARLMHCYDFGDICMHAYTCTHSYTYTLIRIQNLPQLARLIPCYDLEDKIFIYMHTRLYTCIHIPSCIYTICHDLYASYIGTRWKIFMCIYVYIYTMYTCALIHI